MLAKGKIITGGDYDRRVEDIIHWYIHSSSDSKRSEAVTRGPLSSVFSIREDSFIQWSNTEYLPWLSSRISLLELAFVKELKRGLIHSMVKYWTFALVELSNSPYSTKPLLKNWRGDSFIQWSNTECLPWLSSQMAIARTSFDRRIEEGTDSFSGRIHLPWLSSRISLLELAFAKELKRGFIHSMIKYICPDWALEQSLFDQAFAKELKRGSIEWSP